MEIKTNDRFDKLTNLDISTHYRDREYYFFKSDFLGAFAYWAIKQSPYDIPEIIPALKAFGMYIEEHIDNGNLPEKFNYNQLSGLLTEDRFVSIPEIEKLNHPKIDRGQKFNFCSRDSKPMPDYDFIDLGALARNIFYTMLRESITQS